MESCSELKDYWWEWVRGRFFEDGGNGNWAVDWGGRGV